MNPRRPHQESESLTRVVRRTAGPTSPRHSSIGPRSPRLWQGALACLLFAVTAAWTSSYDLLAQEGEFVTCEGAYALCDAAPCKPILRVDSDGNTIEPNFAICDCVVPDPDVSSNIGPTSCSFRQDAASLDQGWLVSTYSFALAGTFSNMTCEPGPYTDCYGYPCVVDPDNPHLATCMCAIVDNDEPFITLGGRCRRDQCSGAGVLWSAATIEADLAANKKLATDMGMSEPPISWCVEVDTPPPGN